MTLGNAAAAHVRLIVWCLDCRHQIEPDPAEMAEHYGSPIPRSPIGISGLFARGAAAATSIWSSAGLSDGSRRRLISPHEGLLRRRSPKSPRRMHVARLLALSLDGALCPLLHGPGKPVV
jgi:hypothetical protein